VYASTRRDSEAARRFLQRATTTTGVVPVEVVTRRAPTYPRVLHQMWPPAWHRVERFANNRVESDHAQLKRRLRPMRGIKTMARASDTHRRPHLRAEPVPRPLRDCRRVGAENAVTGLSWGVAVARARRPGTYVEVDASPRTGSGMAVAVRFDRPAAAPAIGDDHKSWRCVCCTGSVALSDHK
jgi:DDE domain